MVRPGWLRSLFVLSSVALVGATSLACTRVKVTDVKGPGGGDWKAISCTRMNEKCFKTAERMCPNGYVFARAEEASPKAVEKSSAKTGGEATVTTLPPREEWGGEMYSKKPGKILVRCASSPPKLEASR